MSLLSCVSGPDGWENWNRQQLDCEHPEDQICALCAPEDWASQTADFERDRRLSDTET